MTQASGWRTMLTVFIALLLTPTVHPAPAGAAEVVRLAGDTRILTATAISLSRWAADSAAAVVLARSDDFADALAATPLAAGRGPVLLTAADALEPATEAELQRVLPEGGRVYVVGGERALSSAVEQRVAALGYGAVRLSGPTRSETAVAISDEVVRLTGLDPMTILVADGGAFPNALVAGVAAANMGGVLLLSTGTGLAGPVADYLDAHPDALLLAVGGPAADALAGRTAEHIVGGDDYETGVLLAERASPGARMIGLASGEAFPDGLSGGAHAATVGMPLLLSARAGLPPAVAAYLDGRDLQTVVLYGGPAALSPEVEARVGSPATSPARPLAPPSALDEPDVVGSGHLIAASAERTWWEVRGDEASCVNDTSYLAVQDAAGRRATSFPGLTSPRMRMSLSPDGRHAIVHASCGLTTGFNGIASVTDTGDVDDFRAVDAALTWTSDGRLLGVVGGSGADGDSIVTVDLTTGTTSTLVGPSNDLGVVLGASSEVLVHTEINPTRLVIRDGDGALLQSYEVTDGRVASSPDAAWVYHIPDRTPTVFAYRAAVLAVGDGEPASSYTFSDQYTFMTMHPAPSGQLALTDSQGVIVWDPVSGQAASTSLMHIPQSDHFDQFLSFSTWGDSEGELFFSYQSGRDPARHETLSIRVHR